MSAMSSNWPDARLDGEFRSVHNEIGQVHTKVDRIDREGSRGLIDVKADIRDIKGDIHDINEKLKTKNDSRWRVVGYLVAFACAIASPIVTAMIVASAG